jgi:hypothetical protein
MMTHIEGQARRKTGGGALYTVGLCKQAEMSLDLRHLKDFGCPGVLRDFQKR